MASELIYHPTSNPCVYVKDGALYVKTAGGEFEPYSYEGAVGATEIERLKTIIENKDEYIKDKKAECARLKAILRRILKHIDDGMLVRDISKDNESGWALRMMPLVVDLKDATEALEKK